jgi:polysaccharide biosynthesis/export protein
MSAPDRSWHGVDFLNWLLVVMGVDQRMESHPAVRASRISRILMLALVPMLVAWMTVPARSENSAEVAQVTEVNASENTSGEYRLAPSDRLQIVIFGQQELSGDFIVDGTGEILLPLAGSVSVAGLTVAEAQKLIQERFADGVLVQPAVSVRILEYRPIFVTGDVRRPGSYQFMFGGTVRAAIATAGGAGQALEQSLSVAVSDFITAEERVRQLEADQVSMLVRKTRLEAQRDRREDFVMPLLIGLDVRNVDFDRAYSAENDTFLRLTDIYHGQLEALQKQRPRVEAEIEAVTDQIAQQNKRLDIVSGHLADLEPLFRKGIIRKEQVLNQEIEKTLVQTQLSNSQAQVARLGQTMGELDAKVADLKAAYVRQVLGELQEISQRLRGIEMTLGPARKLRDVKAEAASRETGLPDYTISISRADEGRMVSFDATDETTLEPGDVIEVKLKQRELTNQWSLPTEAVLSSIPNSSLAQGTAFTSR